MLTVILLAFYALILFADFIPSIRKKKMDKKTIWIYSVCFGVSFIILMLTSFKIKLPGPTELISYVLEDVIGLNFN